MQQLAKLLANQDFDLAKLSSQQGQKALALYREARGELRDRFDSVPDGRFTARSYKTALVHVQHTVQNFQLSLQSQLRGTVEKTGLLSQEHLARQGKAFSQKFERGIEAPEPGAVAAAMDEGKAILLPQFDSSVQRYGQKLYSDIQRRLGVSMAAKESTDEMRDRIFDNYLQPLGRAVDGAKDLPVTASWAQTLVKTEVGQAYNAMHVAQLSQQADTTEGLLKCWSATMEKETCGVCGDMNGTAIPVLEPFELPRSRFVMAPLAHPNCACTTVAWLAEWGDPLEMGIGAKDEE